MINSIQNGWVLPKMGTIGMGYKVVLTDGYYFVNGNRIARLRIKSIKLHPRTDEILSYWQNKFSN